MSFCIVAIRFQLFDGLAQTVEGTMSTGSE